MLRRLRLESGTLAAAARAARRHATPFYLFDAGALAANARAWQCAAKTAAPAAVFYPYKCNRTLDAASLLARAGVGAEVTTAADLRLAGNLGVPARAIVVQGPAKTPELLDAAISAGALLVADGREDAEAILGRARALATTPRYLLRLAAKAATAEQRPFGLGRNDLVSFAAAIGASRRPTPLGLAFHLGTGFSSAARYLAALREVAAAVRRTPSLPNDLVVDVGGGFAATLEERFDANRRLLGTAKSAAAGASAIARAARRLLGQRTIVLFEPGRALVSGAFHLVARVVRVREGRTRTVYVDASRASHALFVPNGRHPIAAPRRAGTPRRVVLAGPLGVDMDVFGREVMLPPLRPGDLVVIGSVGAYNQNAASGWAGEAPAAVPR